MIISLTSTAGGASSIGYGLTKKRDIKQADNILAKQNENVLFVRADHLKVNSVLDTPMPSDIYRQMQLRQQVAGMKRKDRFFNIKICPSKEDWKALLGFEPVPGKLTDEQKAKVLEVANKLIDASIEKLDTTDHHGYRHNKKGEKYSCITGKHTNLADSQAVWSVHFDTDDIHIHGTANMVTEHNEIQEANMCIDRGFVAGDKVAEKFGLKQLSEYDNQRKERIHSDGISVLKNMKEFNLQTYFAEMMAKGWIIDPNTPDSKGVIHGYSVGEKLYHNDGSLSSVMMFKSSELGHSKDLTPSHLLKTWQKLHAAEQQAEAHRETRRAEQPKQRTATVIPIEQEKPGRWSEEGRRLREEEQRRREEERKKAEEAKRKEAAAQRTEQQRPHEQSPEEKEARNAVDKSIQILNKFCGWSYNVFGRDEYSDLQEGIVGKCLLGGRDTTRENLKEAVNELMGMVEGAAAQIEKATALMVEFVAGMALPQVTPSGGGGGGPTGGWRGKRDDEWWNAWKNVFKATRSRGRGGR
jgi:hypothetical protein